MTAIFKAFSEETRLNILYLLSKKPLCVCELVGALGITQTKTSRHLIYLKNAGLVEARKEDRWMVYSIRADLPEKVNTLIHEVVTMMEEAGVLVSAENRLEIILCDESSYRKNFSED